MQPLEENRFHNPKNYKQSQMTIVTSATFNKSTAFSKEERKQFKLRGLLPHRIETLEEQIERIYSQYHGFAKPIDKHVFLSALKERNATLFYAFTLKNLEEVMPIIYTPTVGDACLSHSLNFRVSQGMYFGKEDESHMREMLENWPNPNVSIIVVTDGSRILGLGDLGANGMGIPVGKLSLYVAAGGFHPSSTLPVTLDFGTNNEDFLNDKHYIGARHKRLDDETYYKLVDEFLMAVKDKWPHCLLQFEDFSNNHCFELLERYKDKMLCFNDDIQGTGAVITSGFYNAVKISKITFKDHRIVILGAGSAAIGVADQIAHLMIEEGVPEEDVYKCFYLVDSKGLVTTTREGELQTHKVRYARKDVPSDGQLKSLKEVVTKIKPTALIGLSGQSKAFTQEILEEMGKLNDNPIIFPLSNPTSKSECTAQEAYEYTQGKAIFASGSPFDPVEYNGKTYYPSQGNNMYIFPGLGFGAQICHAKCVSPSMIASASRALANNVTEEDLEHRRLFPQISRIREISVTIAENVIETAFKQGLAQIKKPENIRQFIESKIYVPEYIYE